MLRKKIINNVFMGAKLLPTKRNKPSSNIWNFAYHITGEKKIGKTSLSFQNCEELVIQLDKPSMDYEVREISCKNWGEFRTILLEMEEIEKRIFPYQRIIIDGIAEWYEMCMTYVCKKAGVDHPTDANDYGKTWGNLRKEFRGIINRLLALQINKDCGLIFISHSVWKEVESVGLCEKGMVKSPKIIKLVPELPEAAESILNGKVDGHFVYAYKNNERILILDGNEKIVAGHRLKNHFFTRKGERIKEIYMGNSEKEAYQNFVDAFDNKQKYRERGRGVEVEETPVKKKLIRRKK